jgi:peptidoglycan-associated lipoprotein
MMIARVSILAAATLIGACSSTPVSSPETVSGTTTARSPATPQSQVTPITVPDSQAAAAGPRGAARIIYFDFESATIRPEYRSALEAHATYLRNQTARKLVVEGHTDEQGGREYNVGLGQKRAEAVRNALSLLGVSATQIEAVSFGEEKPAATGDSDAVWAKNRRSELAYR